VVVAGYLGVDLVPEFAPAETARSFAELFRPGKLIETGGLGMSLGGAVANTGLALKAFGRRVVLNALVGNDPIGDIAVRLLERHGVFPSVRRTSKAPTAYGIVIAPPGRDRLFFECTGANAAFACDDVDFEAVARCRVFHLGYPPLMERLFRDNGSELETILKRAGECGALRSVDMALPDPDTPAGRVDWPRLLERVLPHVDIFAPSIEELLFMADPKRYARIAAEAGDTDMVDAIPEDVGAALARQAVDRGATVVMIKAGHRGIRLATGDPGRLAASSLRLPIESWRNRDLWIPVFKADTRRVKNACGAGDAAVAGFLAAMLEGETIENAGKHAALAGRDNLYGADAISGLQTWEAMNSELQEKTR
jgi:sugar/nucleoside kinase (ribokinase family)